MNVERPLEQNWPLLCLPGGSCLFFEYSFGASPDTKSASEKAPGVQFGMTVHKMTLQKEVVAAAPQFSVCVLRYDGLVGWLAGLFLLDFLVFLTAVWKQIRCMECSPHPTV